MQGGDIDNGFQPCLLVVFEGLLGLPPQEDKPRLRLRRRSARQTIATYTINTTLLGQIRRTPYPVEVVTFLGADFAKAIEERLEDLHALVRRVWATTPAELARIHLTLPDIARIYDPDPSRAFATYGSLGRHLLPDRAHQLGET